MALGATDPQLVLKTTPPRIPKTVLERTRLGSGLAEFAEKSVITLQAAAGAGGPTVLPAKLFAVTHLFHRLTTPRETRSLALMFVTSQDTVRSSAA